MRHVRHVVEHREMRFFLPMDIYGPVKLSLIHVAPVARVERRLRRVSFFRVPAERAKSARVPVSITPTQPGRFITGLGVIVPDQRLAVSRALISSLAERDICEHQECTANKKQSPTHVGTQYSR